VTASTFLNVVKPYIGAFFLVGGIAAVSMLGGPLWFNVTDLLLEYIPMGLLGAALAGRTGSKTH